MKKNKRIHIAKKINIPKGLFLGLIFLVSLSLTTMSILFIRQMGNKTKLNKLTRSLPVIFSRKKYNYFQSKRDHIDPAMVKELIDEKNSEFIILDIRSSTEYKQSHIKGALSLPSYEDFQKSYQTQTDKEAVLRKIIKQLYRKRLIILYGNSPISDMTYDMFDFLRQKNLPVRIMAVSWNEWKSGSVNWLPGGESIGADMNRYIEPIHALTIPPAYPGTAGQGGVQINPGLDPVPVITRP